MRSCPISAPTTWAARNMRSVLAEHGERVTAMYSLETLGFYSDARRQPEISCALRAVLSRPRRFHLVCRHAWLARFVQDAMRSFRSHTQFPTIGGVSPGFIPRHCLVGSLGLRAARLPGADDHRHGLVPLSALSQADRHAGQDRQRAIGTRRERHRARGARIRRNNHGCASTPPGIGFATPVVVGNVIGNPRKCRTAM